ncbi:MAG: hypothetical protein RIS20_2223 [Bacteroidota bacterium]|jgi:hypothetical protein
MKSLKGILLIFVLVSVIPNYIQAQINIQADERIEQQILKKAHKQMSGYRLQICFDSDKAIIDEARNRFIGMYPKIDTYVTFEAPNFNLMVGDFRTLIEAEKIQSEITGQFTIVIVHKTQINLPRID